VTVNTICTLYFDVCLFYLDNFLSCVVDLFELIMMKSVEEMRRRG